ncbi:hypothetical protein K2P97_00070 [bacterium]|nr:hypothetical protein [bacterium]
MAKLLRYVAAFTTIVLVCVINFSIHESGARRFKSERNVFAFYSESIVKDFDLNIINQVDPDMTWMVTKTYNHPDLRENGIFSLNWPVFSIANNLQKAGIDFASLNKITIFDAAQSICNLLAIMIFFIFILTRNDYRNITKRHKFFLLLATYFGVPLFFYSIVSYTAIETFAMALLALAFFLTNDLTNNTKKIYSFFLLGALWGVACVIKTHCSYFLIYFIGYQVLANGKESIKPIFLFALGATIPFSLNVANQVIQWGFYNNYHAYLMENYFKYINNSFNPLIFFGRNGYFATSPLTLIYMIIPAFLLVNSSYKKQVISFYLMIFIMLILNSFRPIQEEEFGARVLMVYLVFFIHFLFLFFQKFISKSKIVISMVFVAALVNLYQALSYLLYGDKFYSMPFFEVSSFKEKMFKLIYLNLNTIQTFSVLDILKLSLLVALTLLALFLLTKVIKSLRSAAICIVLSYALGSVFNFYYNSENVEQLKQKSFFTQSVVAGGLSLYCYDDLVSAFPKFIYFSNTGILSKSETEILAVKEKYRNQIIDEILVDPIGFRSQLEKNIWRKTIWD